MAGQELGLNPTDIRELAETATARVNASTELMLAAAQLAITLDNLERRDPLIDTLPERIDNKVDIGRISEIEEVDLAAVLNERQIEFLPVTKLIVGLIHNGSVPRPRPPAPARHRGASDRRAR